MVSTENAELVEIRKRAAAIRGSWTAAERKRRAGLPPDMPQRLRDYIFEPPSRTWNVIGFAGSR